MSNRLCNRCGGRLGQHRRFFRHAELREIRAGGEVDPDFVLVAFLVVILGDSLTNLHGCRANHGIEIGIVIRGPSENFDTQGSFLERLSVTMQRAFYNEAQQIWEALALAKQRARENPLQLFPNGIPLGFRFRRPRSSGMTLWIDGRPGLRKYPRRQFYNTGDRAVLSYATRDAVNYSFCARKPPRERS
jgi:hypothetical protein